MLKALFLFLIRFYQYVLSPMKIFFGAAGGTCRYTPTCSEYAVQAIEEKGVIYGTFLGIKRILRCHPWGGHGYDPVPTDTGAKTKEVKSGCSCGAESTHLGHFHG